VDSRDVLDKLLAAPKRAEYFGALRAWLERQPAGPARDAALARAVEGLKSWPDATRWAPDEWGYALVGGQVHPLWPLVRRVEASFLDEENFKVMFRSPAMATITDLRVKAWSGLPEVVDALFASPHLGNLTALDIGGLGEAGVLALLQSPMLGRLRRLGLGRIDDDLAARLAAEPKLAGLVALEVSLDRLSTASARALLTSPHLQGLTELRLSDLDDEDIAPLVAGFPRLRVLTVGGYHLRPAALQAMFMAPWFAGLEELVLAHTRLDERSSVVLAERLGPRMRTVDLSSTGFADAGVLALARSRRLDALRELRLTNVSLRQAGLLALVRSPQLTRVEVTGFRVWGLLPREALLELIASPRFADHAEHAHWIDLAALLDLSLTADEARVPLPPDARFTLYRPTAWSPWKGSEIRIEADGRMFGRFEYDHSEAVIQRTGQADLAVVRALAAAARRVQFFTLQPDGPDADRDCTRADPKRGHSDGLITVTLGGVTRSLEISGGCFDFPRYRELWDLARRIELLSQASGLEP
jgi:hypothetical protein